MGSRSGVPRDPQYGRTYFNADDPIAHPFVAGDEFLTGSLDASWTSSGTTPVFKYTRPGVRLPLAAQGNHIRRSVSDVDMEIVAGFQTFGDNVQNQAQFGSMTGIFIVNSSGNGVGFSPYFDNNCYTWNLVSYNYNTTGNLLSATAIHPTRFWLALRRTGNNFQGRYSTDGSTWSSFTTNLSNSFTAATVGVGRFFTSGDAGDIVEISRFSIYTPSFTP